MCTIISLKAEQFQIGFQTINTELKMKLTILFAILFMVVVLGSADDPTHDHADHVHDHHHHHSSSVHGKDHSHAHHTHDDHGPDDDHTGHVHGVDCHRPGEKDHGNHHH
ncbi:hypothetical protein PVAND_009144 [Polypedilum vanderplanki]|uniref:Uncharacterized protein n=1 Tax=Polypedilum vanderplanki TaxID=319348 RepID=A0A9J6CCL5_POLVA|nr:hypothetical protein PVAND_009144 [Polypedilum vanderplanki]